MYAVAPKEAHELADKETPAQPTIWRLRKALYGCRRAPRLWYEHLQNALQTEKFMPTTGDPSLYVNKELNMFVLAHVDDLIISGPKNARENLIRQLSTEVRIREECSIDQLNQRGKILGRLVEKVKYKSGTRTTSGTG